MSLLERRVQLLLQQDQYARLEAEARRSGRSVNAVIRDAIDSSLVGDAEVRSEALGQFLSMVAGPSDEPAETWSQIKGELELDLERRPR